MPVIALWVHREHIQVSDRYVDFGLLLIAYLKTLDPHLSGARGYPGI